ncbi:ubiquitin carboxyl-terminal hydrolase 7-like [Paramacrobiotus metropolitanus]|uniref:ubiquitin carboxyl-terminal hydrolase 7-like n=1 Tax=Paramacrobiotus metropolitanus TaxID=2943436 RepID=UPI0024461C3B|nr:ubiquitin carboxyl-terminal hydrolase 7-like [Paramacrobiotus metropolitanus]
MCKQNSMDASSANRREMLGPALFLIRFPLLIHAQLLDGPLKNGLLLQSEGWDIFHYKHATIKPRLPFPTQPRQNVRAEGVINYIIPDVRKLEQTPIFSDSITVRKLLWNIRVQKDTGDENTYLGLYLQCCGPSGYPRSASWTCQVNAELRLMSWKTEITPFKKKLSMLFTKDSFSWGYSYISMEKLLDPTKGYVNPSDFSLSLQVHVAAELPAGLECMQCADGCTFVKDNGAHK